MNGIIKLGKSTPLVAMQFDFLNRNIVPEIIKTVNNKRQKKRVQRKKIKSGVQVIKPTPNVSLLIFAKQLEEAGYELVDVDYQERPNDNANGKYHMVKFLFSRHECAEPSENFQKYSDIVYSELEKICRQALWRVRGYINPFYKEGEEIKGKNFVSINMKVREPLASPTGKLIKRWEKNDKENKTGRRFPLLPDYLLAVSDGSIKLMKISKALLKSFLIRKKLAR